MENLKTDPELLELLKRAAAHYAAMTPEQKAEHDRQACESYVRAEMAWDEDSTVTFPRPA